MNIPTKEENRFLNYLEEYMSNLEKEKPNSIGKIDLPGFSVFGIHESIIISKSYGFIQWLVENDKIFLGDIALTVYKLDLKPGKHTYTEYPIYESLLMLLAIKDDPINFLISILK